MSIYDTLGPASVRRPSVVVRRRPSVVVCSNIFSETACPIKAKFYLEPSWVGRTKLLTSHLGHMTKMAATPICEKNTLNIFYGTDGPISTKLGM